MLELDLILNSFLDNYLHSFTNKEIDTMLLLLDLEDRVLYDMLFSNKTMPTSNH